MKLSEKLRGFCGIWSDHNDAFAAEVEQLEAERDKYKHYWECADSPLMREVLAELKQCKEEVAKLRQEE